MRASSISMPVVGDSTTSVPSGAVLGSTGESVVSKKSGKARQISVDASGSSQRPTVFCLTLILVELVLFWIFLRAGARALLLVGCRRKRGARRFTHVQTRSGAPGCARTAENTAAGVAIPVVASVMQSAKTSTDS